MSGASGGRPVTDAQARSEPGRHCRLRSSCAARVWAGG